MVHPAEKTQLYAVMVIYRLQVEWLGDVRPLGPRL